MRQNNSTLLNAPGRFAWYELMTTDVAAAQAFYAEVLDWRAQDASTSELPYTLFSAGTARLGGLMPLPEDAKKMGATPRWMGYVGVDDVEASAERITRLGGAIYVPPTNSNIGRIAVVADPQKAIVALIERMQPSQPQPIELDALGRVGWHELLAEDWATAFTFYSELFGWQKALLLTSRCGLHAAAARRGHRTWSDGHLSAFLVRRRDHRWNIHQACSRADPLLALLFQC